jgi:hypothetical protein
MKRASEDGQSGGGGSSKPFSIQSNRGPGVQPQWESGIQWPYRPALFDYCSSGAVRVQLGLHLNIQNAEGLPSGDAQAWRAYHACRYGELRWGFPLFGPLLKREDPSFLTFVEQDEHAERQHQLELAQLAEQQERDGEQLAYEIRDREQARARALYTDLGHWRPALWDVDSPLHARAQFGLDSTCPGNNWVTYYLDQLGELNGGRPLFGPIDLMDWPDRESAAERAAKLRAMAGAASAAAGAACAAAAASEMAFRFGYPSFRCIGAMIGNCDALRTPRARVRGSQGTHLTCPAF